MRDVDIRPARPDEFPVLQAVEVASGEPFREFGLPDIADDDPMPLDTLRRLHVWVAADPRPVAWIAAEPVDGYAHVEQVSVHPGHARQGIGARLLDHVEGWAAANGLRGLTLTTFRDIPWNAPYYVRLGFEEVTELSPGLRAIMDAEDARGLERSKRVCLRRVPRTGV
ncbi:GNAT family N-acetyltransferase [Actinosynnema sp. CS-041913]|uniref:GNAT family N-acetyltransferase n=1 Tax=Actinosynnema sp. CS-041913 TaxID=3239917 RepID=UPI003D8D0366